MREDIEGDDIHEIADRYEIGAGALEDRWR